MICVPSNVTLTISEPIAVADCEFTLSAPTTASLGASCEVLLTATLAAGADVTGITYSSSFGTPISGTNQVTLIAESARDYTLTATGQCDGETVSDSVTITVDQGLCVVVPPNDFLVSPLALDLTGDETGVITATPNNNGVVTVTTTAPFQQDGAQYTFGPLTEDTTAVFRSTWADGTFEDITVTLDHTPIVIPNEFDVSPNTATLAENQTVSVSVTSNNDAVITVDTAIPYEIVGGSYIFGPITESGTAEITATFPDGTTQRQIISFEYFSPAIIDAVRLIVKARCKPDCE